MKLNFDSESGVFTVKAENEEEKPSSKRRRSLSAISSSIFSTLKSKKRK